MPPSLWRLTSARPFLQQNWWRLSQCRYHRGGPNARAMHFSRVPAMASRHCARINLFRSSSRSVAALEDIEFEGYAVGGLAVGEGQEAMFETLEATTLFMQDRKPRYLMGLASRLIWLWGGARD